MKIKVKDLEPNPFRNFKRLPLNEEDIEFLTGSINDNKYGENINVRPHPTKSGKYQIVDGHHRVEALRRMGIEEAVIVVQDRDDYGMVKAQADYNCESSRERAQETIEYIRQARDFLNTELAKYKTWKDVRIQATAKLRGLFIGCTNTRGNPIDPQQIFDGIKSQNTVGEITIHKFLGKRWGESRIRQTLEIIRAEDAAKSLPNKKEEKKGENIPGGEEKKEEKRKAWPLDEKAKNFLLKEVSNKTSALNYFVGACTKAKIESKNQLAFAKVLDNEGTDQKKYVKRAHTFQFDLENPKKEEKEKEKSIYEEIAEKIEAVEKACKDLRENIVVLMTDLKKADVQQLSGLKSVVVQAGIFALGKDLQKFLGFFSNQKQITGKEDTQDD